ncbi:MAG: hypothetical protein ACO3T3_06125, partial [Candidatus Pelagibacter sp.]
QFPFKEWVTSSNLVGLTIYCITNTKDQISKNITNIISSLTLELSFLLYSKYLTSRFFSLIRCIFFKIEIKIDRIKIEKIEK